MNRCTRGCHSRFEGLKGRRRRRTRTGRHVRQSSVARRNTAAAHRIAKKNAIFLPFSPLLGARNVCDARGITALINIGHDEYPTIDASLPPNRGSISIVHSLCVHSFDPRLRSTRKIFLPSCSVAVADSGLRGSARFDSGRERERANGKGKTGGGREKKKKKRKRLYAALPFDLPTTVAMLHGVTVYHAQNVTNDRANVERGSASDSCVKRSRTAYRRALLDLCC